MRPILFQWRGITVRSYPAMLYLGTVAGVAAGNLAAHAAGVDAFRAYVVTCIWILPALIGAKLLYAALHWATHHPSLNFGCADCVFTGNTDRAWDKVSGGTRWQTISRVILM